MGDLTVVAMDFGIKANIPRMLKKAGCRVMVVPARTTAKEVLDMAPDGVILSNGPGDPEAVPDVVEEIQKLFGKVPIFGICLGQQLLGLAYGGSTYKLKFGHRGANQPIKELATGRVCITSENHGFAVDPKSIEEAAREGDPRQPQRRHPGGHGARDIPHLLGPVPPGGVARPS